MEEYKGTEMFQLLVSKHDAASIIDEWAEREMKTDIRIRRARTRGHVVVETRDVLFASFINRYYPYCKVNIK